MSSHSGVSCDSCMTSNFTGRRYKCLLCDNYDLCGKCFDTEAESQNHRKTHAMQCILTDSIAEIFYKGETIARRTAVSLTCPYCAQSGYIPRTLLTHCAEKHSTPAQIPQVVMCPICVSSGAYRGRSRFVLLAEHIITDHDDPSATGEDDTNSQLFGIKRRDQPLGMELQDDEPDDEVEENWMNEADHIITPEIEQRRNEASRRRLLNLFGSSTISRQESNSGSTGANTTNPQRRFFAQQTSLRFGRGNYRGGISSGPYGLSSRSTSTTSTGANHRTNSDAQGNNNRPNQTSSDSNIFPFGQDPFLDFITHIVNGQRSSPNISTTNQPITPNTSETSRNQQSETPGTTNQTKSTSVNSKQKSSSQTSSASSQANNMAAQQLQDTDGWGSLHGTTSNFYQSHIPNNHGNDSVFGSSTTAPPSKFSQNSNPENESRSLILKMLKQSSNVNTSEMDEARRGRLQDQASFVHSIILSTVTNSSDDNDENQQTNTESKL